MGIGTVCRSAYIMARLPFIFRNHRVREIIKDFCSSSNFKKELLLALVFSKMARYVE